jgi:hypothetical protein
MRGARLLIAAGLLLAIDGCGGSDSTSTPATPQDDRALIQESLTEVITRWHFRDKAGLYDNEFDYLRERMTFDQYLQANEIKLDADTVMGIEVKDLHLFGRDSADVAVEIIFEGPTKLQSRMRDAFRMYRYHDKWIRPTLSNMEAQVEYDRLKKSYEEAAEAEAKESGGN